MTWLIRYTLYLIGLIGLITYMIGETTEIQLILALQSITLGVILNQNEVRK